MDGLNDLEDMENEHLGEDTVKSYLNDSSGSEYEAPSGDEDVLSPDEDRARGRISRQNSRSHSQRSTLKRGWVPEDYGVSEEDDIASDGAKKRHPRYTQEEIRQNAQDWAARFQRPDDQEVRSPARRPAGSRSKKRELVQASLLRAKRVKGFHSNEYRELLNVDIHDMATRTSSEEQVLSESTQIGSSIWTSQEKNMFFCGLSRLGRDNVRGISELVQSKSEPEVQEMIQVLHQNLIERDDLRHQRFTLDFADLPAAVEVSQECCAVLERAADALASRQERYEEELEKEHWGEPWLLTPEVCSWISRHRSEPGGEEALEEVLPVANLFNLKKWLQLPQDIFMNPAAPREEDNWQELAEPGEQPAIRATALQDFHSLAVNLTKRLVSATLFCTMSKLRALDSHRVKYAEVSAGDVAAAIDMLGLAANSKEYWRKCARRCNLEVYTEEQEGDTQENQISMTYEEVEKALSTKTTLSGDPEKGGYLSEGPGSESERETVPQSSAKDLEETFTDDDDDVSVYEPEEDGAAEYVHESDLEADDSPFDFSDPEADPNESRREHILKRIKARKANEQAHDEYTEAVDTEASRVAEEHLWKLLRQSPPLEIKIEPVELPERPVKPLRNDAGEWRGNTEFWSEWEMMDKPIPLQAFARARYLKRKRSARQRPTKANHPLSAERVALGSDSESGQEGDNYDESDIEESSEDPDGKEHDHEDAGNHSDENGSGSLQIDVSHVSVSSDVASLGVSGDQRPSLNDALPSRSTSVKSESDDSW
ncbi:hypothetical protein BP5796_01416 [Coleophoma crateriformis]|uniref:Uncharacterized protein n=1 Tax=Coleophoma crateriformis TaxID=565419 RepID=A0A3D8T0C4_9HELO|nr:hypothetical protein BP5796_01416 [Coleophoma crateriformis]